MNQDRSTQILFALVFIATPALYFLWRLMPYILFYVAPFAILSLLLAGFWFVAVTTLAEEDYSWLALIIPLSAIAVFLTVGFPKVYLATKAGSLPIDGIFFYNAFNAVKAWFDSSLWSLIPEGLIFLAPTVPVPKQLYDLNDVRWILWVSLGIGAPAVFLLFSGHKVRAIKAALEEKYQKIAKDNQAELDSVRAEKYRALREAEIDKRNIEQERDHYREEHAKLKTLIEFQKKAAGSTNEKGERETTKGVLDSEDL
jgi:hypothetical protein